MTSEDQREGLQAPSPEEIQRELQRVVDSSGFSGSTQLVSFLRYVIAEFLAGRGSEIRERNIAVKALSRAEDFDPRIDSAVRVTAIRLRKALKRYYETDGAGDPVHISLPKGSYAPEFRRHSIETAPANATIDDAALQSWWEPLLRGRRRALARWAGVVVVLAATVGVAAAIRQSLGPEPAAPTEYIEQTGALPYRFVDGEVQVLIVRNRDDTHWTIPKATQRDEPTREEVAAREAYEDGGVAGQVVGTAIGEYFYTREAGEIRVTVYPVLIDEEYSTWLEDFRAREWCDRQTALQKIRSEQLAQIVYDFEPPRR